MFANAARCICQYSVLCFFMCLEESFGDGKDAASDAASEGETLLENFGCEQGAVFFNVVVINLLQLLCRDGIEDESVHFIVEAERTRIEVRGSDGAEDAVYHHDLAVMEPSAKIINLSSAIHQFSHFESCDVVVHLSVALRRNHELHSDASLQCPS